MDLEKLSNILGADTVKKIYEDTASQPLQEGSKALVDLIKAARLFTAPIQLLAAYQDRLSKVLDKVRSGVPEERQIEAPASLTGPILEKFKYLDESNYLSELYMELLSRAIDKERVSEAHPAFFSIIEQISPDEALVLYYLREGDFDLKYSRDLNESKSQFKPMVLFKQLAFQEQLIFPQHFFMYLEHLRNLNLLYWSKGSTEYVWNDPGIEKDQRGITCNSSATLSEFGQLFVKACIPNKIFVIK